VAQTGATTGPKPSGASDDPNAYSACMRSRGVPTFPDPGSTGQIRSDPRRLGESGIEQQQAMLRFARCMRSHGVPNFPDPQPGGALDLAQEVAAPNTPRFTATEHTCRNVVPGAPIPAAPSTRKPTP
jgi:hypothetical protein